jgi:hypothetical protein
MAEGDKARLVNVQPEAVTETQASRVLRMIDLQPGSLRAADAQPRQAGQPLFKLGETASIKGCTFEVVLIEGALLVLKYRGLTEKQKLRQLRQSGVKGRGAR